MIDIIDPHMNEKDSAEEVGEAAAAAPELLAASFTARCELALTSSRSFRTCASKFKESGIKFCRKTINFSKYFSLRKTEGIISKKTT
jgi:hypothetical protein